MTEADTAGPGPRPLVSVLMPCFDHEAYVEQAVESVWRQTHRPLELIAVDDGSRDRTPDLLTALAARSPIRMTVHRLSNRGIAGALNAAFADAAGEWISLLASDDAYTEEKIERQLAAAATHAGCLAVHSDYLCIGPDGDPTHVYQGARLPAAEGQAHHDLLHGRRTIHSVSIMIRASALADLGGWDESYAMDDWPLFLRLSRRGSIAYCPEKLVLRRVHPHNVSARMSQYRPFSPRDAGVEILRSCCDSRREFELCASVHVSVVMRNSIARGGWRRAAGALGYAWRQFPGRRPYLLAQVMDGLRSHLWLRLVRPLLPHRLVERLSAARTRRLAARLAGGGDSGVAE